MSSNLACVGLAVDDIDQLNDLVRSVLPASRILGRSGSLEVVRWEDPGGSRLVLRLRNGQVEAFLPSFAGSVGVRLAGLVPIHEDVWAASVVDDEGEQQTSIAVEIEQHGLFARRRAASAASLVALGNDVAVFADESAFAASDASRMGGDGEVDTEPPPLVLDRGWPWPPRMAPESFISHGVFAEPSDAEARATLFGTVLHAETRTTLATGQTFVVARVRTIGMEVDLCLEGTRFPTTPPVGSIIGGTVLPDRQPRSMGSRSLVRNPELDPHRPRSVELIDLPSSFDGNGPSPTTRLPPRQGKPKPSTEPSASAMT